MTTISIVVILFDLLLRWMLGGPSHSFARSCCSSPSLQALAAAHPSCKDPASIWQALDERWLLPHEAPIVSHLGLTTATDKKAAAVTRIQALVTLHRSEVPMGPVSGLSPAGNPDGVLTGRSAAAWTFRYDPAATVALTQLLASDKPAIRQTAATTVGMIGPEAAAFVPKLKDLAQLGTYEAIAAMEALQKISPDDQYLMQCLTGDNAELRVASIVWASRNPHCPIEAFREICTVVKTERDLDVVKVCLLAIAGHASPASTRAAALIAALDSGVPIKAVEKVLVVISTKDRRALSAALSRDNSATAKRLLAALNASLRADPQSEVSERTELPRRTGPGPSGKEKAAFSRGLA